MSKLAAGDWIQVIIAIVLFLNLVYFWYQVDLTKRLNQPICGVKGIEPKVTPVPSGGAKVDVVSFAAILVNSGNYPATETTVSWKWFSVQNRVRIPTNLEDTQKGRKFVFLPKQELTWLLFYEQAEKTRERILGYEKYDEVEILVEYRDMKNELHQYSCTYKIMRLLTGEGDFYDSLLVKSNHHQSGGSVLWKWFLIPGLAASFAGLVLLILRAGRRVP